MVWRSRVDITMILEISYGAMKTAAVIDALGALAHEHRLAIYRLLVEQGPAGLPAGAIGERVGLLPSSLTFHLQSLQRAGLITQVRASRQLIYSADYTSMNELVGYLTDKCCAASGQGCATECAPRSRQARQAKDGRVSDDIDMNHFIPAVTRHHAGAAAVGRASDGRPDGPNTASTSSSRGRPMILRGLSDSNFTATSRCCARWWSCRTSAVPGEGTALLKHAEEHARTQRRAHALSPDHHRRAFFAKHGYSHAPRDSAPDAIRATREFSGICPASSAFMKREL